MNICCVPSLLWCYKIRLLVFSYFNLIAVLSVASNSWHPRHNNASDQEALIGFMSAINPTQSLPTNWYQNVSFCEWTGVMCSRRRQRVVSLNVSNMGLQGAISPLLGNLSFLRILDLSNNSFHGHVPYQLGNLSRLELLHLYINQLQGSIPPTLGGCRNLQILSMAVNHLVGKIPSELCVLPNLQFINFRSNNLTGSVPACLGNLSFLDTLNLGYNNLHGRVPSELGMLSQLTLLSVSTNHLTGQFPSSLSNCTNLLLLSMTANHLTDRIPSEFCSKNSLLTDLYLSRNQLSGNVPTSLFNCTKLQLIDLGTNELSGVVPMEVGKLKQLQTLSFLQNQLVSGSFSIFTALTNCSTLINIELMSNHLTGQLPTSIGLLSTQMERIDLNGNEFGGEIPPQIGNLTSLISLDLGANHFTGAIPSTLNMLQRLQMLYMPHNNLQCNIPNEIGQLKSLGLLSLGGNNLSGRIPDSVSNLQQLRYLGFAENDLSGKIPASLGKCVNLLMLNLSYNRFSGHIPLEIGGLANLAFYFDLSNNLLDGPVPFELSKFTMVQTIDISGNQLTGYIPSALRGCKELESLILSSNALEGPIPISLDELQSLKDMDFSSNNLSGEIPKSLENLKMLRYVNFSFNKLSGEVPQGGVFKKLGATSFMGNLGLCGPWVSLAPCSAHKHKSISHLKRVIIAVGAVAVIVVSCLLLGILWRRNHKKHNLTEVEAYLSPGYRRITYREMSTATNEFSDANLLGVGSFGKVYKGFLNDGTMVAIKLLNLENEGAHKSFDKECKVLGRVRHRNLIRIITSYSDIQVKALIFPFMPSGSLEMWLYPDGEEESRLSLIQRLNIAIDIAQGMAYLHHYCFMQVIHCDLKPNNVLLGEDMTAYLIDFGIATIYFADSGDLSLSSIHALKGSSGYIPPEYGLGGKATTKGDVYSYGILLLEMLTRKKPIHNMFVEGLNLQNWVSNAFPNQVWEVVDESLFKMTSTISERDKELNCLSHLISLGLLCTKESPKERPTMIDIVEQLQSIKDIFLKVAAVTHF